MVREITAILVSWKDEEDLIGAVSSLACARGRIAAGGPRASLVVVDNGGGLSDHGRIFSLWPDAAILVNGSNLGFGPAANQAAETAKGDALLFLNPDTRAEGDPFTEIARAFAAHPDAVAVAPRLLDFEDLNSEIRNPKSEIDRPLSPPDREDQFTFQFRRLPDLADDARELLLVDHLAPNSRWRRRFRYADADRDTPFAVEQPAAAAFAIRKDVFRRLGGFDSRFTPAWFEDVDLAARLRREGPIVSWPASRFRHRGGVASASLGYARFLPAYYRNALLYRRLHYSAPARLLYRPLLAAGMLLRLGALPFRRSAPRPRAESARAYVVTLAVALGIGPRKSQITNHKSQIPHA
ncbi:MAG TPA: glycosyltransferase family 2 protein [Thermoanaerobaculia bacterium]|nr:glycosyltransferase family 2 protein [Thermoanaerobaculia bacterium]